MLFKIEKINVKPGGISNKPILYVKDIKNSINN